MDATIVIALIQPNVLWMVFLRVGSQVVTTRCTIGLEVFFERATFKIGQRCRLFHFATIYIIKINYENITNVSTVA